MTIANILVVEDETAIADTILYALRTEGMHGEHCALGHVALQRLREQAFDLVVLDVGLPDTSGFEVCRALRAYSNVPVIFLTARHEEVDRVVGLEIGADDYVVKPFSPRELVARVRVILRRVGERAMPQYSAADLNAASLNTMGLNASGSDAMSLNAAGLNSAGSNAISTNAIGKNAADKNAAGSNTMDSNTANFEVDDIGARIAYRGRWLDLTRYEYRLLAQLLQHPGRIYSRAQLMELVWRDAIDTIDRTVDTHIKTVRAKLRAIDPTQDPIRTHRGMGYSLEL